MNLRMQSDQEFEMIIHDIRKPLASMELFLRVLEVCPPERQSELLKNNDSLIRQVKKANLLLDNLLGIRNDLSNGESCYLEHIVCSVLKDMSELFIGKEIEFHYDFNSTRQLLVDKHQIERLLFNLITNAIEAMPSVGQIWFKSKDCKIDDVDFIEIQVGNSHSFIEPEFLDQIFKPFYTRNKKKGTGLGLAICKKAVEFHGGQIRCQSDQKRGTEFTFTLPAPVGGGLMQFNLPSRSNQLKYSEVFKDFSTVDIATMRQIKDLIKDQSFTVAIIEDDEKYLSCLRERIVEYGRQTTTVSEDKNFFDGFHTVLKNKPQIVLVDYNLSDPIFTGIDLIKALRDHQYSGLICLHSNHVTSNLLLKSLEAGADLCVPKPLSAQNFLHILNFYQTKNEKGVPASLSDLAFVVEGEWNFTIEKALDLIPYPIFSKDREGRYQICNQSFSTQILGLPKSQIYNRGFLELAGQIPKDLAETYRKKDEDLFTSKGMQTYHSEVLCSDGRKRDFTFFKKALLNEQGDCVGLTGILYPGNRNVKECC